MEHVLRCYGEIYDRFIVRAKGCEVFDNAGQGYLDLESGVWSAALGHCHPIINRVLHEQIEQIMHLGYRYKNSVVETAAQAVLKITGHPQGKCIFLCSGSEAVEFSVQATRRITQRPLLLGLRGSYLGAFGSAGKPDPKEWHFVDWSACSTCSLCCCEQCPVISAIPFSDIGGFIFEPGNSSGLVMLPPNKLVETLVERVKKHGGLVVANEVTTGLGRTGMWFGYQHYGLKPDIVALGKHLGNGYPVSAVALSQDTGTRIEKSGVRYAQSHQNDALGCAVATSVIEVLSKESLVERASVMGQYFLQRLQALQDKYPSITAVRGRGLMLAVELKHSDVETIHRRLFEAGVIAGLNPTAKVIRFYPPLIICREEIDRLFEILPAVIQ